MANITGTPNNDILVGTSEADNIRGLEGNDIISGLDGDDQIDGGTGNDSITGNSGNDSIFGSSGDDTLFGGLGDDVIVGEAGNDIIGGDAGSNTLTGGVGRDIFVLSTNGTSVITDFFSGDDSLGLSGDLTIDNIEATQSFANTLVIDRRTGNVLATLNNVTPSSLRLTNFVDANGRPVSFAPGVATLVDVTATDPIASATNPNDPIVFTVSRTNTSGELTVNFTLSTTTGVTLQNPPTSVRILPGQTSANVIVTPQSTSRDGNVTLTLQDNANYNVRTGVANGTVTAPVSAPSPAPQPTPDVPTFVDLVLSRVDIPGTPSAGQTVTTTFTVFNRGTGRADRVELNANLPIDTRFVSAVPSQGVFTAFSGDTTRGGIVNLELGSIDPDRGATVVVTYVPQTTGNVVLTNANVTTAQPDVDPSNNFANAGFTIIPSPPSLPTVTVIAVDGNEPAQEPDTTQLEGTDREIIVRDNPTGLITRDFAIRRTGGDLTRPLTVNYTLDGTAQNGVDFAPIGGSVVFAPFQTEVRVTIRPIQDRQVEETEFVRLTLVPNPLVFKTGEVEHSEGNTARINILDVANPIGPNPLPGTVVSLVAIDQFADEFRPPSASGGSTPGAVSPIRGVLRVTRDNTVGDLTVNVEVSGTANRPDELNFDYSLTDTLGRAIPVSGGIARITIPDGQSFIDVFLEAVDDDRSEGDEDAIFNLAPGASYVIGRPQDIANDRPAVIRIRDNETPPTVSIATLDNLAIEGSLPLNSARFVVSRTGDLAQPREVIIELSGTATVPAQLRRETNPTATNEDYFVVGSTVFLGDSLLTTLPSIDNLGANRFKVVIPAGSDRITFDAVPVDDLAVEGQETVIATIVPPPPPGDLAGLLPQDIPPQGFIVAGGTATAEIVDNDVAGGVPSAENPSLSLTLSNVQPVVVEGGTNGVLRITRTGPTTNPVNVPLQSISFQEDFGIGTVELPAVPAVTEGDPPVIVQPALPQEAIPVTGARVIPPLFITFAANQRIVEFSVTTRVTATSLLTGRSGSTDVTSRLFVSRSGDISQPLEIPGTIVESLQLVARQGVTLTVDTDIPSFVTIPEGQSFVDVPVVGTTDFITEGTESLAVILGPNLPIGFRPAGNPQVFIVVDGQDGQVVVGTDAPDILVGTPRNDRIVGGLGADNLTGGAGIDAFIYNQPSEGPDTIIDFVPGVDIIQVSASGFGGGLVAGSLPAALFTATFTNATQRFSYNGGVLSFDPDGNGALPSSVLANLTGSPVLTASSIVVI